MLPACGGEAWYRGLLDGFSTAIARERVRRPELKVSSRWQE